MKRELVGQGQLADTVQTGLLELVLLFRGHPAMFRIHTPQPAPFPLDPGPSTRRPAHDDQPMADDFLDELADDLGRRGDLDAGEAGRVTGPGEVIADAQRWMRCVSAAAPSSLVSGPDDACDIPQGSRNVCPGRQSAGECCGNARAGQQARERAAAADKVREAVSAGSHQVKILTVNCPAQVPRRSRRLGRRPDSRGEGPFPLVRSLPN